MADPATPARPGGRAEQGLEALLGILFGGVLFLMMTLTFVDVLARYTLRRPVPGSFEITELLLVTMIFLALPVVSAQESHIEVDLLRLTLGPRGRRVQLTLINAVSVLALGLMTWRSWVRARDIAGYGDVTDHLRLPLTPVAYLVAVSCALATVACALNAWRHASGRRTAREP